VGPGWSDQVGTSLGTARTRLLAGMRRLHVTLVATVPTAPGRRQRRLTVTARGSPSERSDGSEEPPTLPGWSSPHRGRTAGLRSTSAVAGRRRRTAEEPAHTVAAARIAAIAALVGALLAFGGALATAAATSSTTKLQVAAEDARQESEFKKTQQATAYAQFLADEINLDQTPSSSPP
jgi:hypothetical protein